EPGSATALKRGDNKRVVNRTTNEPYRYQVKDVEIKLVKTGSEKLKLFQEHLYNYKGTLSIGGVVNSLPHLTSVSILGRTIPVENNTFEALLKNISPSQKQVEVYANTATEKQLLGKYPLTFLKAPNPSERFMEGVASIEKEYTKDSKTVQGTLVNQQAALTLQD